MNHNLLTVATATMEQYDMIRPGDRVLVALSGGADSMALLYLLHELKEPLQITLSAAHVNHGIRGDEALADEALAQKACKELGIPFYLHRADVPALAKAWGMGEEACGRRVRYEFFDSIPDIDKIATAHTAGDNAETVLMNLTRGTGLLGLCGIPPVRGNIIRPLLACTRSQVEAFCRENAIVFGVDSTNQQDDYTRNRVRHQIIPLFLEHNPGFFQSIARCTAVNRKDFDYLSQLGQNLIEKSRLPHGYSVKALLQGDDVPLTYAVAQLLAEQTKGNITALHREQLLRLLKRGSGCCSLPGVIAQVEQGILTFSNTPRQQTPAFCLPVTAFDRSYQIQGRRVTLRKMPYDLAKKNANVHNLLTYIGPKSDTISKNLLLRNRLPGDTITLAHRGCSKSLKKLFNEEKIPASQRMERLILADENGVLWVEGIGCDKRCQPKGSDQSVIVIEIQESSGISPH